MLQEPLLFIPTTPFYYVEVEEREERSYFDESTSVYEIHRTERVEDSVIARQLNYFSQPINSRTLLFHMKNGENHIGMIEEYKGRNVKIKTTTETKLIDGNEIEAISISSSRI